MRHAFILLLAFSILVLWASSQENTAPPADQRNQIPALLSFDDLVTLSSTAKPKGPLGARLQNLLNTPFVSNDATAKSMQPHRPTVHGVGPVLRVGLWNIERGLNFELIRSALKNTRDFERLAGNVRGISNRRKSLIESQLSTLQDIDVLVLNEVDLGMKRTEYRDVAQELAAVLGMNYAYGVEFVEVDPVFELGTEPVHLPNAEQDQRLQQDFQVDRARYRGLHGTAVLSRYPIRRARILRLPNCYDWYGQEAKAAAKLEKGKRWASHKLFKERIGREVRHGGRMALIADLSIPDLPTGEATIIRPGTSIVPSLSSEHGRP